MVELADRTVEAAWKIKNLGDYERWLARAARAVDELDRERGEAALVIYESALTSGGRPVEEVRAMVRRFRETFENDEEQLTLGRAGGIMNTGGDEWFFEDEAVRTLASRLLGQFQHRVAQYNYVDELEVLRRWADGYDTRLFVRRRIHDTEPVAGVVPGVDLPLMQYLRVAAGGDTVFPSEGVARALGSLGFGPAEDPYEVLAWAEGLALRLDLPSPVVGAMLEDFAREGFTDFPEPPRETAEETPDNLPEDGAEGGDATSPAPTPDGDEREAREGVRRDPGKGDEPARVQDPQAKDAPGVPQESASRESDTSRSSEDDPGQGGGGTDGRS